MTAKYQRCGPPKRAGIIAASMFLLFAIAILLAIVVPYHDNAPFVSKSLEHSSDDVQHALFEDSHHSNDVLIYEDEHDSDHDHFHENDSSSIASSSTYDEGDEIVSTETKSTAAMAIHKSNIFDGDETPSDVREQNMNTTTTSETRQENNRDSSTCVEYLSDADANSDDLLQTEEYVSFLSDLRTILPVPVDPTRKDWAFASYSDLPYELKVNFLHLSCLCDDECCERGSAWGIYTGGDVRDICERTEEALRGYLSNDGAGDDGSRRLRGEGVSLSEHAFLRRSDNDRERL